MRHKTEAPLFSEHDSIMEIQTDSTNNTPAYGGEFSMTEQLSDCIIVNGEFRDIHTYPLEQYWSRSGIKRPSFTTSYNCARGYTAVWHLQDNQLFLLSVDGFYERNFALFGNVSARFTLATLGLSRSKPIKANWFSGKLRVPRRKAAIGEENSYGLPFERELIISIDKGEVVMTAPIDNTYRSMSHDSGMLSSSSFGELDPIHVHKR